MLNGNLCRRQVEAEIVSVDRSLLYCEELDSVFVGAEVPSCDVLVTHSRSVCCLEEGRVSGEREGSLEEDKEEASDLNCRNVVKHKGILDCPVVGID